MSSIYRQHFIAKISYASLLYRTSVRSSVRLSVTSRRHFDKTAALIIKLIGRALYSFLLHQEEMKNSLQKEKHKEGNETTSHRYSPDMTRTVILHRVGVENLLYSRRLSKKESMTTIKQWQLLPVTVIYTSWLIFTAKYTGHFSDTPQPA